MGLFVLFFHTEAEAPKQVKDGAEIVAIERSLIDEKDSDNDGLKDWEEAIWKTDPNNPSTHGKPDNEYVAEQVATADVSLTNSGNNPIKNSEELGQQLFAEYIAMKQSGDVNPQQLALLVERISKNISPEGEDTFYSSASLTTFPDSDSAKLRIYADTLISTTQKYQANYASKASGNSLDLASGALNDTLLFAADFYLSLADTLMAIDVPEGAAEIHTDYVNSLKESGHGLMLVGSENTDPLIRVTGLQRHIQAQKLQEQSITSLGLFLSANGIINFALLPL